MISKSSGRQARAGHDRRDVLIAAELTDSELLAIAAGGRRTEDWQVRPHDVLYTLQLGYLW